MPRRLLSSAVVLLAAITTACATLRQDSGGGLPPRFTALGTEPFWATRVDGRSLLYQTPEDQAGKRVVLTRRATAQRVVFSGTLDGLPLTLAVAPGPCSDGMSDTVYSHSAELRIGRQVLKGCARPL